MCTSEHYRKYNKDGNTGKGIFVDMFEQEYGVHIAEAHHIEYFVNSLNNQMVVYPNYHGIIHDMSPI